MENLYRWFKLNPGKPFDCGRDVLIRDLHVCSTEDLFAVATIESLDIDCIIAVQLIKRAKQDKRAWMSWYFSALWRIYVFAPRDIDDVAVNDDRLALPWACPCAMHEFGDFRVCEPRIVECDVDAWFSSQSQEWIANFRESTDGMPYSWQEIALWNRALANYLQPELAEFILDDEPCNNIIASISSLYPLAAVSGVDLLKRVSIESIKPSVPMWREWIAEKDEPISANVTVWDFAKEAWKPVLPRTGITFSDLAKYDPKGATAFNSFLRARLVRPSDVIAAWERELEYSFKKKLPLTELDAIVLPHIAPDEFVPGPPVPRSDQRLGIYKKKPVVK